MEEAELTSWRFVSSPFSLDLSKTKQQLIPGVPFLLQVSSGRGRMSSGAGGGGQEGEKAGWSLGTRSLGQERQREV